MTDAFLAVAAQIFTAGTAPRQADRAGAGRNRMGPLLWDGCEVGPGLGKSRGQFGSTPFCNDLMSSSMLWRGSAPFCASSWHFSLVLEAVSCPASVGGGVTASHREVAHSKLLCSPLATGAGSLHGSLPCSSSCCWCWEPELTHHKGVPSSWLPFPQRQPGLQWSLLLPAAALCLEKGPLSSEPRKHGRHV